MKHLCHWTGCKTEVAPSFWGCGKHWFTLPKVFRDRIWQHYREGQEIDKNPSDEYMQVMIDIEHWISQKKVN